LLTASVVGFYTHRENLRFMIGACTLVILGVFFSCLNQVGTTQVTVLELFLWGAVSFGVGAGLVLNSLGNTHLRQHLGAPKASVVSAGVASLGNLAIMVLAEFMGIAHLSLNTDPSTVLQACGIGATAAYFVFISTKVPDRIGFPFTFVLSTAGKMTGGVIVDAVGVFRAPQPLTLDKGLGVLAVLAGAVVMKAPLLMASCRVGKEFQNDASVAKEEQQGTATQPDV